MHVLALGVVFFVGTAIGFIVGIATWEASNLHAKLRAEALARKDRGWISAVGEP